jgi:hypothetical protein
MLAHEPPRSLLPRFRCNRRSRAFGPAPSSFRCTTSCVIHSSALVCERTVPRGTPRDRGGGGESNPRTAPSPRLHDSRAVFTGTLCANGLRPRNCIRPNRLHKRADHPFGNPPPRQRRGVGVEGRPKSFAPRLFRAGLSMDNGWESRCPPSSRGFSTRSPRHRTGRPLSGSPRA